MSQPEFRRVLLKFAILGIPAIFSGALAQENNDSALLLDKLQQQAAELSERIVQQEDLQAIENLQRIYGFFFDKGLWREAADLFTEDGRMEIAGIGIFSGRERVYAYLQSLGQEGPRQGRLMDHLLLQPVISLSSDGQSAQGRWHLLSQGGALDASKDPGLGPAGVPPGESFGYLGTGIYENEYRKSEGLWRIHVLRLYPRMTARDSEGWGRSAYPFTLPAGSLVPDAPFVNESYAPYPGTYIVPEHYPHPVNGR